MTELNALRERVDKANYSEDEIQLVILALVSALDLSVSEASAIRLQASACAYLDAVVGLVTNALPGWHWDCSNHDVGGRSGGWGKVWRRGEAFQSINATPANALLSALLSALASKQGGEDEVSTND